MFILVLLWHATLIPGCSWARMPARAAQHGAESLLSIEVHEPHGLVRSQWPLTVGVPFPQGKLRDVSQFTLVEGEAPIPTQTRALSRWPDGSVRWLLLDWQSDFSPRQVRHFHAGTARHATAARHPLTVTNREDGVAVDTGVLQFIVPKNHFAIVDQVRIGGGTAVIGPVSSFFDLGDHRIPAEAPLSVTILEPGPLRARIEIRGHYRVAFEYVVRIDAFAGQPFVRILHSFEQHSAEAYTFARQIAIDVPVRLDPPITYAAGRENAAAIDGTLPNLGVSVLQADNDTLQVNGQRQPGHAAGWVDLRNASAGVALASRFFWQEYPQSFHLQATSLTYNLWPAEAAPAKIGMGAAKTHELVLQFHGQTAPTAVAMRALVDPVLPRVDAQWIVSTGALRNSIAPNVETNLFLNELMAAYRRYEKSVANEQWDDSGAVRCPDPSHERPRRGFFGMFNWGDWNYRGYHDSTKGCDAWGNLEYDLTQVLALAYAATAEPIYHERMVAAARHFMDVDRIHYQHEHPNWVGMNHPKNPLHFTFELGGVDLGHTWTEGLLSYYYFTGDERALQAATGIADYLVRRLRTGHLRGNPRQFGWPQIALIAAYDATANDAYRQAALGYARSGMAAHPPDALNDWKLGILAEALSYTHSVTQDSAIEQWLRRYATGIVARGGAVDARFMPAVAYVGRITGNRDYTRAAMAAIAHSKLGSWGKPLTINGRLAFRVLSLSTSGQQPTDTRGGGKASSGSSSGR